MARLAVDTTYPHKSAEVATSNEGERFTDSVVISVVEAELQLLSWASPLGVANAMHIGKVPPRRFFAEHMAAAPQRRHHDIGSDIVGGRDEDGVHIARE